MGVVSAWSAVSRCQQFRRLVQGLWDIQRESPLSEKANVARQLVNEAYPGFELAASRLNRSLDLTDRSPGADRPLQTGVSFLVVLLAYGSHPSDQQRVLDIVDQCAGAAKDARWDAITRRLWPLHWPEAFLAWFLGFIVGALRSLDVPAAVIDTWIASGARFFWGFAAGAIAGVLGHYGWDVGIVDAATKFLDATK
jgi:hypothetical protein